MDSPSAKAWAAKRHHHRRSSLPNLKLIPLTKAEKRLLARQKKKEAEERQKEEKKRVAEEKKLRAKQLRQASKKKDKESRSKYTLKNGRAKCDYCGQMIEEIEFDDHKVSHPTRIRQRIWLGNAENSKDINFVKKYGVSHILNCTREIDLAKNVSKKIKSFKRISIQDKNHETILDYIKEANNFIETALYDSKFNIVFIHCREGRSRSVSFLCAYLMWKESISFYAALSDVRSKRHIVLPNNKFYHELEKLDKELIIDRMSKLTPRSRKYGKPKVFFLLKINQNGKTSNFPFPASGATDDHKHDDGGDHDYDFGSLNLSSPGNKRDSTHSPASVFNRHGRQRSSSVSGIASLAQLSGVAGVSGSAISPYHRPSGKLSPIQGSPNTKRRGHKSALKGDKSPYDDIDFNNGSSKKKKKKKSSKNSKKKKKKKSGKHDDNDGDDLVVEEAMDVTDIFPNGDSTKRKKKKSKDKKNKKSKKSNKSTTDNE